MKLKPGGIRAGAEVRITDVYHPITGNVATDGVVYSAVATVGTAAVAVWNGLIFDPGFSIKLQEFEVGLTQKFTGLNGAVGGSIGYYWEVQTEADRIGSGGVPDRLNGAWVNVTGTYLKSIGTLIALEDSFAGRVALGSLPYAPIRARLMAWASSAANVEAKIKNSTYGIGKGLIIPGT